MAFKEILKIGNPQLTHISEEIAVTLITDSTTKVLVESLFEHMLYYGGVGIAAPQIGYFKRVFVYGFDQNPRYPGEGPIPLTAVINPKIIYQSSEKASAYEGCLSAGNLRGKVPRSKMLTLEGYNTLGELFTKNVFGFEARIIQHEIDHLDGIIFPQRVVDFKTFGFLEELKTHGLID